MTPDYDEELINKVRKNLFGNLAHYRQRCINERDDAITVLRFMEQETGVDLTK